MKLGEKSGRDRFGSRERKRELFVEVDKLHLLVDSAAAAPGAAGAYEPPGWSSSSAFR